MTGLVIAAGAVGVLLVYSGLVQPAIRSGRTRDRVSALAAEAGLGWSGTRVGLAAGSAGVSAFLIASIFVPSPLVALIAMLSGAYAPFSYLKTRRRQRRRRLREAWPDAIAALISSIRSGASLADACTALSRRGPSEMQAPFEAFRSTYRSSGSFEASLGRLQEQLSDPIADRVVVALRLAHQVGGTDLVRVLRTLGDFVRDDLRVRKEIEARWSWTITAARVAAAGPWIVLAMMATRPEAANAYNSPTGAGVVLGGAIATAVGYRLMLRAARLPEDRRLAT